MIAKLFPKGMRRRWWLFRPIDALTALWPAPKVKRGVLVVRMDGIGDMVLHRAALDHLADALGVQQSDITLLGCNSWKGLIGRIFQGYRVETIDEHAFEKKWFYRLKIALWIKRQGFKVAVCDMFMRKVLTADSLVSMSGAEERIVCKPFITDRTRREWDWYLGLATRVIDTGPYPTHDGLRHFTFLSVLSGRTIPAQRPSIPWQAQPSPVPPDAAPYVVMNFGSNEPGRRWPLAKFLELAGLCRAKGWRVVFVGGGAEAFALPALNSIDDPGIVNAVGQWTLPQVVDAMVGAMCVITNDTGPGHLALGSGATTILIAGGGHWGCFVPYPDSIRPANARFLTQEMPCFHCLWRCPKRASDKDAFPCVGEVSVERVWVELAGLEASAKAAIEAAAKPTDASARRGL